MASMVSNVVFMGSPEFAVPSLHVLAEHYPVVGVSTQPDRPAGRGRKSTPPPIKVLAEELNLPVIQPRWLHDPEAMAELQDWNPDLIVVAAFGQILQAEVLDLPPNGSINVHASLLPRWRGAAPIQAAILHGDDETGITIMKMDIGIDTGPILTQRAIPIEPDDTAGSLSPKLSQLGAELLLETLPAFLQGDLTPQPQDDSLATYAPMLKKANGALDFSKPALELANQVRAYDPWPGTFMPWQGKSLKIHHAHAAHGNHLTAGQTIIHNGLPAVATAYGLLVLDELQPAGKRRMAGDVFLNGAREWGRECAGKGSQTARGS